MLIWSHWKVGSDRFMVMKTNYKNEHWGMWEHKHFIRKFEDIFMNFYSIQYPMHFRVSSFFFFCFFFFFLNTVSFINRFDFYVIILALQFSCTLKYIILDHFLYSNYNTNVIRSFWLCFSNIIPLNAYYVFLCIAKFFPAGDCEDIKGSPLPA